MYVVLAVWRILCPYGASPRVVWPAAFLTGKTEGNNDVSQLKEVKLARVLACVRACTPHTTPPPPHPPTHPFHRTALLGDLRSYRPAQHEEHLGASGPLDAVPFDGEPKVGRPSLPAAARATSK